MARPDMKSAGKVRGFNIGAAKPSRATIKKLEDESKKKEEEEHTKQVFKEFVETFEGDTKGRTWIKGGVVNPASRDPSDLSTESRIYRPLSKLEEKTIKPDIKPEAKKASGEKPALGKKRGQEQKKSKLEQFKEELKLIQQQREQRHALKQGQHVMPTDMVQSELDLSDLGNRGRDYRNPSVGFAQHGGSAGAGLLGAATPNPAGVYARRGQRDRRDDYPYDFDGDQTTTNLFLGNLNPKMTEQQLCEAFGRYGPLASVKIMWPRTDEERSRGRNCGFVAFMNRRDGERALENIRGKELMGFEMKLGWGKSVPIPLYPVYIPPSLLELIKPPPPSGLPFNAQPRAWLKSLRQAIKERAKLVVDGAESEAIIPPGPDRKPFDTSDMSKEKIEEGESSNNWRTDEFRMFECGPFWRPPPMNLFSGGMPEDLVEDDDYPYATGYVPPPHVRRNPLSDAIGDEMYSEALAASRRCGLTEAQKGRFVQMLTDLEPCRVTIGEVMVWCLEHADSAADITDCIVSSLSPESANQFITPEENPDDGVAKDNLIVDEEDTKLAGIIPIPKALARLFLVSDILYNSSAKVPNASYFRKCFETRLSDIFRNINGLYKSIDGKLRAEQLKQRVMVCFRAWEDWAIYPNDYLIRLQNIFLGLVNELDDEEDLAGVPLLPDGLDIPQRKFTALDSNVEVLEGIPLVQYDGDPLDVDGSPLTGESEDDTPQSDRSRFTLPLDPKHTGATPGSQSNRLFVPSKWETVDPATVESEAVTTSSRWELLVDDATSNNSVERDAGADRRGDGGRWETPTGSASIVEDDDDVDGQPLTSFGGLVAYDDEDAMSPVPSEPDFPLKKPYSEHVGAVAPLSSTGTPNTAVLSGISEERRAQLREIELKVLKYQDELEASRRGDRSITDEAMNKQIHRYRERLMDRLNDDDVPQLTKKPSSITKSKSKSSKSTKSSHREHSNSPIVSRDHRDRSPPRSFRDRDRSRRRSPSADNQALTSASNDTTRKPNSRSRPDSGVNKSRLPSEELEEGEASEEEEALGAQRATAKRRYNRDTDVNSSSPKSIRKRQRSRSPASPHARNRRSRSPSPTRKRSSAVTPTVGNSSSSSSSNKRR